MKGPKVLQAFRLEAYTGYLGLRGYGVLGKASRETYCSAET